MVAPPTSIGTRYAKSGEHHIAYQVHGSGEIDLIWTPSYFSHLEVQMEESSFRRFVDRLGTFARVILFDKRGTGLSDRVALPGLDDRMDDFRAVLDAVGSDKVALLGTCEGGALSALFAATYPERTRALILANSFARSTAADGYPWAQSMEEWQQAAASISEFWGTGLLLDVFAPSALHDPRVQEWWPRFQRQAVSPSGIRTLLLMNSEIDVRHVLASVNVPTLVLHSKGDRLCPIGAGRYMAERVPEAQFVELPGDDHYIWFGGDADRFADEVERFLTGTFNPREPDRALVTILFVDIADSTRKAAQLGDRTWRDLVDSFYAVVRNELERTRGRLIDTAGDGVFAAFDGPARAIQAGLEIAERVQRFGLTVRAGVHIGEAEIVGDGLRGITVHIGSRVASKARESEVLVSSTVRDLVVGSGFRFADRGSHALKGVTGRWQLYSAQA